MSKEGREIMKKMRFSHIYKKFPLDLKRSKTYLIGVTTIEKDKFPPLFLKYDTEYMRGVNTSFYKLPKGKILLLTLFTTSCDEFLIMNHVWTTIRRWLPEKEKYYQNSIGEEFEIEMKKRGKFKYRIC
jgi:hypothetical protein